MRFSTCAIAAVFMIADSANRGESRQRLVDRINLLQHRQRRDLAVRTKLGNNAKTIWENRENHSQSTEIHDSMPEDEVQECGVDVGILDQCGQDQVCVPNSQSKRGGICRSMFWEQNSRELQQNTTYLEPIPSNYTGHYQARNIYRDFCQEQYTFGLLCNCTKFDNVTLEGEISCTDMEWCDGNDPTLCGSTSLNFYLESGSNNFSYCVAVSNERFCYSANARTLFGYECDSFYSVNGSLYYVNDCPPFQCFSASVNGCECECEFHTTTCSANEPGIFVSCPNNVTSDFCDGIGSLFGNKINSCESNSATNIPDTTDPTKFPLTSSPKTVVPDMPNESSTSSLLKGISIGIGGLVVVVAMIVAAFLFNKKRNAQKPSDNAAATAENIISLSAYVETVDAISIAPSNIEILPTSMEPASSMDNAIRATAIVELGALDLPVDSGNFYENVLPIYKDQVRSFVRPNVDDTDGIP